MTLTKYGWINDIFCWKCEKDTFLTNQIDFRVDILPLISHFLRFKPFSINVELLANNPVLALVTMATEFQWHSFLYTYPLLWKYGYIFGWKAIQWFFWAMQSEMRAFFSPTFLRWTWHLPMTLTLSCKKFGLIRKCVSGNTNINVKSIYLDLRYRAKNQNLLFCLFFGGFNRPAFP